MDAPEGFRAVRTGGIVKFVPLTPTRTVVTPPATRVRRVRVCMDCGTKVSKYGKRCVPCNTAHRQPDEPVVIVEDIWTVLRRTLQTERHNEDIWTIIAQNLTKTRPANICECGCLLHHGELCPLCVIPWMRTHDQTPDVIYYQPQKIQERRAA